MFHAGLILLLFSKYCTVVRPILDYRSLGSVDRCCQNNMIEKNSSGLQHLLIISRILCIYYTPVRFALSCDTLANRRRDANLSFLSNLLTNKVDRASLLSLINLHLPKHSFSFPLCSPRWFLQLRLKVSHTVICLMRLANEEPSVVSQVSKLTNYS